MTPRFMQTSSSGGNKTDYDPNSPIRHLSLPLYLYRRVYIPGGTYFFTLVTYDRQPIFADGNRVQQLRQSFREVKAKRPFDLLAAVVLPDHLHCLWCLPDGDADYSTR
jgi:REP element-mobilizing transposase RayT